MSRDLLVEERLLLLAVSANSSSSMFESCTPIGSFSFPGAERYAPLTPFFTGVASVTVKEGPSECKGTQSATKHTLHMCMLIGANW